MGAYDDEFSEIEAFLKRASDVIESDPQMAELRNTMAEIEPNNADGKTRFSEIFRTFQDMEDKDIDAQYILKRLQVTRH